MDKEKADMIIYTTEDGLTKVETTFDGDTVWLSIDQMAELFQRDKSTISRHIKNIFIEGELQRDSVVAKFATTASDGKVYNVDYYNLDVIISVGYRVKSKRGTQFRIWATGILKEYMRKGFVLDDDRLKNLGGGGYFKELLDRIRDIRASEKVFYLVIDRDGEDEKVYFLTEVSENDLLNTTTDNSETLPKNSAALESAIPTKDSALSNNNADTTGDKTQGAESVEDSTEDSTEDTSEPKEDTAKADGSGFTYILMGIAAVAVIGVVYVVKSKKKKENFIDEDEDEDELDEDYDYDDEEETEQDSDEAFINGGDDTESVDTDENDNEDNNNENDEENGEE